MVTTSATALNITLPSNGVVGPRSISVAGTRPSRFLLCRRCDTRLIRSYDEPRCSSCGYVYYPPETAPRRSQGLVNTATRFVHRYAGDFPALANTLIYVRLIRVRNRVVYAVNCPFCEKAMDQSSLSGTRHEPRELRYKCMDGHRVSLVPTRNGASMGWK